MVAKITDKLSNIEQRIAVICSKHYVDPGDIRLFVDWFNPKDQEELAQLLRMKLKCQEIIYFQIYGYRAILSKRKAG